MHDTKTPAEKIAGMLDLFLSTSGLRLRFHLSKAAAPAPAQDSSQKAPCCLHVDFTGPDTSLLTAHNADLLHALEHLATQVLRLSPEEHHLLCFDAAGFKAARDRALHASALAAIERVRATRQPFAFPPMSSRERRLLHLALAASGLLSLSTSDGPRRFVVLYPPPSSTPSG